MLPIANPILMGLLAAYCAMASPVNTQPGQVQDVIEALKAQLKADNITDASALVNEAETSLWAHGVLDNEVMAKLEREIKVLTTKNDISVDAIAQNTIAYLNTKGAIQDPGQEHSENKALVLDAAIIKQVVDHGVTRWGGSCPDGSQSDCCVIM